MIAKPYTDVVVIGGGPAGSTVSTLLAQHGCRVELFERERFPRFHIGESLIPETYWVFKRLNMLDKMKASHFVKKYSVQFVNAGGKLSAPFYFHDNKPHECSQTWQVIRSEFDTMMLDNAREHGVDGRTSRPACSRCCSRATGPSACASRRKTARSEEVRAKVVVDASGQSTMLQNRFKLRLWDPVLNKGAIWTYWEGAYRDTGRDEGATMVIQTTEQAGLVVVHPAARQHHQRRRGGAVRLPVQGPRQPRADLQRRGRGLPGGQGAHRRAADATTGYFATKDYSYRSKQVAGDGWVLVGDAFGFLDPLYSSGVLLALKSGELAADAIAEGLAKGDMSAAQLGKWGDAVQQGRRPHAPAGVRILRRLQLRQVRAHLPATARAWSPTC